MTLKYTKFLQFKTTLAFKDNNRNITVFMKAKKPVVRRSAFPKLLPNSVEPLITLCGMAHIKMSEKSVT